MNLREEIEELLNEHNLNLSEVAFVVGGQGC